MRSFILSSMAAAVVANPVAMSAASLRERQTIASTTSLPAGLPPLPPGAADAMGDDLQILLAGGPKLAHMIGDPKRNDRLRSFAALLGAGKGTAGPLGPLMNKEVNGKYGKVVAPAGAAPTTVTLPPREKLAGSKSVKLRYGPYLIPNAGFTNRVNENGMLSNAPDLKIDKPCEDCTLIGMQAGLEYPDGKNANIDSGLWLHHFVLFNEGPGRSDATCQDFDVSLPHVGVGVTAQTAERLFSSGNERVPFSIPRAGVNEAGYMLNKEDKFHLIVDLMNQKKEDTVAYLTITYDFVDGHPQGWADVRPVWFDAMQCGTSEVNAPKSDVFTLDYDWTSNFKGKLISAAGHVHDGGVKTELYKDGKLVCTSNAKYGGSPEYIEKPQEQPMGGHGHMRSRRQAHGHGADSATVHISSMSNCIRSTFAENTMDVGQKWSLKAHYDFTKNKGMVHGDGSKDHVMGISIMFVEREKK